MSTLTKITDELLAVVEPVDSEDFYFVMEGNIIYERLGTVSETEIDFDCDEYVEKYYNSSYFKHYLDIDDFYKYSKGSFRSLLKSKGITPTTETKIVILKKI